MIPRQKKEVLLLLPEPPQALRESGISIRYIPLIESIYKDCILDAIIISKESYPDESLSLLKKYCRNVFCITHPGIEDISFLNKLMTRALFIMPWSYPRSWLTYCSNTIKDKLLELISGIEYHTTICVSGYNYPFTTSIQTKRLVVDFIDSPTVLSWRNVIGSNRNYFVRLFECFKTFIWEAVIIRRSDASLYISSYDVSTVPGFMASSKKRFVIRNGYSADDYSSKVLGNVQQPSIGFLGNMSYYPNIEAVVWLYNEVFLKLKKRFPSLNLYIIGRSPSDEIMNLAKSRDVIVTGAVDSIWEYLNSIDIMVFPLLRGAGVKNKIIEAMYANRLVLTTSIGDEGIDGAKEGALILCNNSKEYIEEIAKYLEHQVERTKVANSGREFVINNFSWNQIQDKFKSIVLD